MCKTEKHHVTYRVLNKFLLYCNNVVFDRGIYPWKYWIDCWFGMCSTGFVGNGGRSSDTSTENTNRQRQRYDMLMCSSPCHMLVSICDHTNDE